MAYEYERTCRRCGKKWFVAAGVAEAKPQKRTKAAGWATPLVGKKRQQVRAEAALVESHNARLAQSGACPDCGSSAYDEKKVDV